MWLYMHPRLVVTKKGVTGLWKDLPLPASDLREVGWPPAKVSGARAARAARTSRGGSRRSPRPSSSSRCWSSSWSACCPAIPPLIIMGTEGSRGGRRAAAASRSGSNRPLAVQYVEWLGRRAARRPRPLDPVRPAGRPSLIVTRLPVTLPLTLLAAGLHGRGGDPARASSRPPTTGAGGDYLAMIALPARGRGARVLGGPAPDPLLLGARSAGCGRAASTAGRQGVWPALRSLLLPAVGARPLPVRGAGAHHALGRARGAARGLREDGARQGRGRAARARSATRCATR